MPAAFAAMLVVQVLTGFVDEIPQVGKWFMEFASVVAGSVAFVLGGRWAAPSHKSAVGFVLAGVIAACSVWMTITIVRLPGFSLAADVNFPRPFGEVRTVPIWWELATYVVATIVAFAAAAVSRDEDQAAATDAVEAVP